MEENNLKKSKKKSFSREELLNMDKNVTLFHKNVIQYKR